METPQDHREETAQAVGGTLEPIAVFKSRFIVQDPLIYGLLLTIADLRTQSILRLRVTLSYNPSMFETPLEHEWYTFERTLYASRLREGALQAPTQEFEQFLYAKLAERENGRLQALVQTKGTALETGWQELLAEFFRTPAIKIQVVREDLNLAQYQGLRSGATEHDSEVVQPPFHFLGGSSGGDSLLLQVTCEEDPAGKPARELAVGEMVLSHIVDHRDIGQYLARLLGGRSGEASVALTTR
ncbi:MAG: hypothetical protein HYZ73_04960, partial [Elusimicrobia bacterium]|nr:hypothetical protein [Elusimicrobiota bacterium]